MKQNKTILNLCDTLIGDIKIESNARRINIIGIDGPTAAGKTIFANQLAESYRNKTKR